jgi:hypothetical protein
MGHVTSAKPWGDIDIDTTNGSVFFQQKWFYYWNLYPPVKNVWTHPEKEAFHRRVDTSIWRVWSNKYKLKVSGTHEFAKKFSSTGVSINFDVKWVVSGTYHWTVTAYKMAPGSSPTNPHRSNVILANRTMELNTADVRPRGAGNDAGVSNSKFETPAHEFAHTFDNPDEYNASSPHIGDSSSLVNIGHEIRNRHVRLIVNELNSMIFGVHFSF